MIGIRKNNLSAFTLMEVMVSVALFSVIILSVTSIFKLSIDGQRSAIATQNVQESLKYFLELTSKEIRMAQKDEGVCPDVPDNTVFAVAPNALGDTLFFKNYYGECVRYFLENDGDNRRFKISRQAGSGTVSDFISPQKIKMNSLQFIINEVASSTQAMVTINLNAEALGGAQFSSAMTLQTSITSRYYKE